MCKTLPIYILAIILFFTIRSLIAQNQKTVIVLSAPSVNDSYYASVFDSIISFDVQFANTVNSIHGTDNVIILTDNATKPYLQAHLPDSILLQANVADIWIRDFSPLVTAKNIKFDFKPNYLSSYDANYIDNSFRNWYQSTGLQYDNNHPLIIDGGNFVWNRKDKAIITERVFTDNPGYTLYQIDSILKNLLNLQEICYLPEESGDLTGHSDGMVMFVDTNKIFVNTYTEPFRTQVLNAISTYLTNVSVTEVVYPYDTSTWNGWPSACGIYLNCLITENYIYMPVYGLPDDLVMQNLIQTNSGKQVIAIDASSVCYMGGSVRCLTWVVTDSDADTLLHLINNQLSINEVREKNKDFKIYPNLSNTFITAEFKNTKNAKYDLTIIDVYGQVCFSEKNIISDKIVVNVNQELKYDKK